jgi:uncharacterized protein
MTMLTLESTLTLPIGQRNLSEWHAVCRRHMLTIDTQFDPSHRIDHVDRVMQNALSINKIEHGNMAIIIPAVMLHDCVPIDKRSAQRSQASRLSADAAIALLQQWQYPEQYHAAIAHAIACHSFSANIEPTSLEAKIVQDADRLDSLGAIGIARTFMCAGKFNSAVYAVDDPFAQSRECNDKQYAIDHFYQKLLTLKERFQTPTGRKIATQRTQLMQRYLNDLAQEI